ncbi:hypothetical protein VNO78_22034 [Psophocarpus tetragonolobus]|uniref:Uncharacterized protein n=1 Tax=Psophocarpus tetragonolobus TaxID=3891 RepID=A0AAN9SHG0_PSOTE
MILHAVTVSREAKSLFLYHIGKWANYQALREKHKGNDSNRNTSYGAQLILGTKQSNDCNVKNWARAQSAVITKFQFPYPWEQRKQGSMALEHAVSSWTLRNSNSSSSVLTFPKTLISKPQFQFGFQFEYPSWRKQRRKGLGSLKCSMTTPFPKPSEIPWQKELCNSVNLIGVVAAPVEIKHFPSGKVVAWTRLSVKKNASQSSSISLNFWDDLAQVASQHLQQGHQIHVSGRLITDTVENEEGKTLTYYKVVAQQLNFIERSFSTVSSQDQDSDFAIPDSGRKVVNGTASVVELWQAFFANPGEWWDNRNKKRNPKAPDFKHKDTGEALWIEGRYNPPWVKSQLEILDARMGSIPSLNARRPVDMVAADEIFSF